MIYRFTYDTVLGSVTFVEEDGALLAITTHRPYEGIEESAVLAVCVERTTAKERLSVPAYLVIIVGVGAITTSVLRLLFGCLSSYHISLRFRFYRALAFPQDG